MPNSADLPTQGRVAIFAVAVTYLAESALYVSLLLRASRGHTHFLVTGVVLAFLLPPVLLSSLLGTVVDRVSPVTAWATSLFVSAALAAVLTLTTGPAMLVAVASAQAATAVVASSAGFKVLPLLAGSTRASSLAVGAGSFASLCGPPLAALIAFYLGLRSVAAICGCAYGVASLSIALLLSLETPSPASAVDEASGVRARRGMRSLSRLRFIGPTLPLILGVVLVTSVEGVAGVFYLQAVAGSTLVYTLMLACWALGSLCASGVLTRRKRSLSAVRAICVGGLVLSATLTVEGAIENSVVICAVFIMGGSANALHNVGVRTLVYDSVPVHLQGRVWATLGATFSGVAAVGNLLGTPEALFNPRTLVLLSGALGLGLAAINLGALSGGNAGKLKP